MGALAPDLLGSRSEFLREWGSGDYGMARHAAVKNPAALGTYLRDQGLLLRRTRKDVHRELPDPIEVEQHVDTDHATIEQVAADVAHNARVMLGEVEATRTERFQAAGEVDWRMRQATGLAKAAYVAEFAKLLLESEERIVLFGWHRGCYDVWLDKLAAYHPVLYTGTESPQQKARAAEEFKGGQARILIMSLRSGAGLDGLQDWCSVAVFGELDWSPEVHRQCTGRLARDGQESTVVAYYMVSDDGTDPLMADVLGIKKQQAEPIRDPHLPLFTSLAPATDRARALAAAVLQRGPGKGRPA
jgi:SNF2 family DNA or RNA helicase